MEESDYQDDIDIWKDAKPVWHTFNCLAEIDGRYKAVLMGCNYRKIPMNGSVVYAKDGPGYVLEILGEDNTPIFHDPWIYERPQNLRNVVMFASRKDIPKDMQLAETA